MLEIRVILIIPNKGYLLFSSNKNEQYNLTPESNSIKMSFAEKTLKGIVSSICDLWRRKDLDVRISPGVRKSPGSSDQGGIRSTQHMNPLATRPNDCHTQRALL